MLISPRSSQRKQSTFRDVTKAFPAKVKWISQRFELLLETNLVEKEPWEQRGRAYQSRDTGCTL